MGTSITSDIANVTFSVTEERKKLESEYGQVWDTRQIQNDFSVKSFMAPFVIVKRKSDGATGTLKFQHSPRLYYSFKKS